MFAIVRYFACREPAVIVYKVSNEIPLIYHGLCPCDPRGGEFTSSYVMKPIVF